MRSLKLTMAALAVLGSMLATPLTAQSSTDTLSFWMSRAGGASPTYLRGTNVQRLWAVKTGPDSTPASTANADSLFLNVSNLTGYGYHIVIMGTAASSNQKQTVVTAGPVGAQVMVDSLQWKTAGGNWIVNCYVSIRTTGNAVTAQPFMCTHAGSGDSVSTNTAGARTSTVSINPTLTTNMVAVHNGTGTAKGDVVVTAWYIEAWPTAFKVNTTN